MVDVTTELLKIVTRLVEAKEKVVYNVTVLVGIEIVEKAMAGVEIIIVILSVTIVGRMSMLENVTSLIVVTEDSNVATVEVSSSYSLKRAPSEDVDSNIEVAK